MTSPDPTWIDIYVVRRVVMGAPEATTRSLAAVHSGEEYDQLAEYQAGASDGEVLIFVDKWISLTNPDLADELLALLQKELAPKEAQT